MNLKDDLARGERANRILSDPIVTEAFDGMREAIFRRIDECPLRDMEGLQQLKMLLKLTGDLRRNFEEIVKTGKLAEMQIEQERKTHLRSMK